MQRVTPKNTGGAATFKFPRQKQGRLQTTKRFMQKLPEVILKNFEKTEF